MGARHPITSQIHKIRFTGNFWPFFGTTLLLVLLGIVTLGLGLIYLPYWQAKYFFAHMEIVLPPQETM